MKIINTIQTICPKCHIVIEAYYIEKNGKVFLNKTCPDHGEFSTFIAPSLDEYLKWTSKPTINIPTKSHELKGANEEDEGSQCPLYCGLCSNHLQTPCCVLIEITQRCNQHCPYCFASSASKKDDPIETLLTLEILSNKLDHLLKLGEERPFNIQFSGGEPTIRNDLPEIIRMAKSKGFPYIQINTNGKRLAQDPDYAKLLKDAGASVIFLQFDGTNDKVYRELRGEDLWEIKEKAIKSCRVAGLPVTLVPTLVKNINMDQISPMLEFLWNNLDIIAGIHFQPVSFFGRFPGDLGAQSQKNKVTLFELIKEVEKASNGLVKSSSLLPMNTGHSLCGFHGEFLREKDGSISVLKVPSDYDEPRDPQKFKTSCCSKSALETITSDRGFALNKWAGKGRIDNQIIDENKPQNEILDFDEFLIYLRNNMFTISAMAFQDLMSLDGERLKRCRVHVLAQDNRMIPFCSYNTLYREEDLEKARYQGDSKKTR